MEQSAVNERSVYQLTVWIDPDGALKSGVQYSNGSGNLIIAGHGGRIEDIRFVMREDQQADWRFSEFKCKTEAGPGMIDGEAVIKLVEVTPVEIKVEDRLEGYGRYKYTIEIKSKNGGDLYTSDPEFQNVREVGPN